MADAARGSTSYRSGQASLVVRGATNQEQIGTIMKNNSTRRNGFAYGAATLAALAVAACGGGGGGGDDPPPPTLTTLEKSQAFLAAFDASLATSIAATGAAANAFSDGCSLDSGNTKLSNIASFDNNVVAAQASEALRIGSTRTNVQVLAERNLTNADGSNRQEVDVQYEVRYKDGAIDPDARNTLISGSSSGSCATPDNLTTMRFFGNRKAVGTFVRGRNLRDERYALSTGLPQATPLTYRREVQFGVADPQGAATYAIVTGPGPTNTINGVVTPFSMKLLSPRVLRSEPLLLGKNNNYVNWPDTDFFRTCRAPAAVAGTGVPVASVADCVGEGAQGSSWGWTLNNPSATNLAAADAGFEGYQFAAGGTYTFAIYNDDGWKTVNGQAGKTPIATYTTVLEKLPYAFSQIAGTSPQADLFPRLTAQSATPVQVASAIRSGGANNFGATVLAPTTQADARKFGSTNGYEYFEGPNVGNTGTAFFPASRYSNPVYSADLTTAVTFPITVKPAVLQSKTYAEHGWTFTDRNGSFMQTTYSYR